jgi:hypothetical protein
MKIRRMVATTRFVAGLGRAWGAGIWPQLPGAGQDVPAAVSSRGGILLARTISGCSGDDFVRWHEQSCVAAGRAAGQRTECGPGPESAETEEAARASAESGRVPGHGAVHGPFTEIAASEEAARNRTTRADGGEISESLARNLERARARWKARGGLR